MKVVFLSETNYVGKWPADFVNARTEVAWQIALDSDHFPIHHYREVIGYDHVFIIFPKGKLYLSAEGSKIADGQNPVSKLLRTDIVQTLKGSNAKVYYVQEGPHWWFNDYEIADQIYFYNFLYNCDAIFAHNESDAVYYKGLFNGKPVHVLPSLMIEDTVRDVVPTKQEKAIIGGNFARWYGGFESYMVASSFKVPAWTQTSHAMRAGEDSIEGLNHLPRMHWTNWIKALSEFKYAVHLMPTVAAGTFSLNCAYLGIPCIGNEDVDTQRLCHPSLAVKVSDIEGAQNLATRLLEDKTFYEKCSQEAQKYYQEHYSLPVWKTKMNLILAE